MRTAEELRGLIKEAPHLKNIEGHAKLVGGDKAFFEIISLLHHAAALPTASNGRDVDASSPQRASNCPVLHSKEGSLVESFKLGSGQSMHSVLDQRQWTQHLLRFMDPSLLSSETKKALSEQLSQESDNENTVINGNYSVNRNSAASKSGSTPSKLSEAKTNETELQDQQKESQTKQREGFSKRMKAGTSESHKAAENVQFVRKFIQGEIDPLLYKQLIADLYHVYNAMELLLAKYSSHPLVRPIYFPSELNRTEALEEDMLYWFGENWRKSEQMKPTPCTQEYLDRLYKCTPGGLVAHAYTRYMGDLSGGRVLMSKAKKALSLQNGEGLQFYIFENISSPIAFKNQFRDALDGLDIETEAVAEEIITEANIAFLLNMRLFTELDMMAGEVDEMQTLEATVQAMKAMSVEPKIAKCPFAKMGSLLTKSDTKQGSQKKVDNSKMLTDGLKLGSALLAIFFSWLCFQLFIQSAQ